MNETQGNHALALVGGVLLGFGLIVSATEIVPGWEMLGLGLPQSFYYLLAPTTSALGLCLCFRNYPVPALAAGAVGGLGAVLAMSTVLEMVESIRGVWLATVAFWGFLPGLGLGWFVKVKMYDADERAAERQRYEAEVAAKLGWPVGEREDPLLK